MTYPEEELYEPYTHSEKMNKGNTVTIFIFQILDEKTLPKDRTASCQSEGGATHRAFSLGPLDPPHHAEAGSQVPQSTMLSPG